MYFTKYLPIPGEIKDGNYGINSAGSIGQYLLNNSESKKDQKVQLFLCSRDIKVGDKFYSNQIDNGIDMRASSIKDGYVYNGSPYRFKLESCYKTIGLVSLLAIWVNEGDKLIKDQIKHRAGFIPFYPPYSTKSFRKIAQGEYQYIRIKCPCCGTYK